MANKIGSPDYFSQYILGKGSGGSSTPDLFSKYVGGSPLDLSSTNLSKDDATKKRLKNEIDNLKQRAQAYGVNTNPDDRNAVEKFLNLHQNQGLIGDTFQLMGRPMEAAFGAGKAHYEGKSVKEVAQAALDGIDGHKHTGGYELWKAASGGQGVDNPEMLKVLKATPLVGDIISHFAQGDPEKEKRLWRQTIGGSADVTLDPLNFVGGALGKGVSLGVKGGVKGASALLDIADKNKVLKTGLGEVGNTLKEAFVNTAPESVKNLKQKIEAQKTMLQERALGITNNLLKHQGLKAGDEAALLMEDKLHNNPETADFAQKLVDGTNEDAMRLRGGVDAKGNNYVGKDVEKFVQDANFQIHNSEKFQKDLARLDKRKLDHTVKIANLAQKYGSVDELNKMTDSVHELLQQGLEQLPNRLKLSGMTDEEVARHMDEIGMNVHDDLTTDNLYKMQSTLNKYDKGLIERVGLDKPMVKEILMDKWNLDKSMAMAAKSKGRMLESYNPLRIKQIEDGGQGFQITKTNSNQVAQGLRDKEALVAKFGQDNVEIPKIQRELSDSPGSRIVADQLSKMQQQIVDWGSSLGIEIPQIEGYMRHALTQEYKDLNMKPNSTGLGKQFGGNKKVINPRDLYGSAHDVNEMMGKNVFETNAYKAMVQAHTKVTNYIATEAFVQHVMADPNLVTKVTKDTDISRFLHPKTGKLLNGYAELKMSDFKFYKTLDQDAKTIMAVRPNDKFIADKGTVNLMRNYDELVSNHGNIEKLVKYFVDAPTKLWKGITLMTPGYHARNLLGNGFNRDLAGMGVVDQMHYDTRASKLLYAYNRKILPAIAKGETLTPTQQGIQKTVEDFYSSGLRDNSKVKHEMGNFDKRYEKLDQQVNGTLKEKGQLLGSALDGIKGAYGKATGLNYKIANTADDMQRFSMYMWAKANKVENPVLKVKEALFDYSDLTQTERGLLKRVMPFYTFARKNLPYQVQNLIAQPHKYNNLNKMVQGSYALTGQDQKNMPDYLKNSYAIGSPFGTHELLKSYLPAGDLMNYLDSPSNALSQVSSSTSPLLKLPFELTTNTDFFRQQKIKNFEGEKSKSYGGIDPKLAYTLDQLGGKPTGQILQKLLGPKDTSKGGDNTLTNLIPSLFSTYDPSKVETSKLYDERTKLQDLQKKFKQDNGIDWKTLNQLKKGQNSSSGYFGF